MVEKGVTIFEIRERRLNSDFLKDYSRRDNDPQNTIADQGVNSSRPELQIKQYILKARNDHQSACINDRGIPKLAPMRLTLCDRRSTISASWNSQVPCSHLSQPVPFGGTRDLLWAPGSYHAWPS